MKDEQGRVNPYASPVVENTSSEMSTEGRFFHHRASSLEWSTVILCLPILLALFGTGAGVLQAFQSRPISLWPLLFSVALFLTFAALAVWVAISFFLYPKVFELWVDQHRVVWTTPELANRHVLLNTIDRVEYRGVGVAIVTSDGKEYTPNIRSYGGSAEELVAAIKNAIALGDPTIRIREESELQSISLMRQLGRIVGRTRRWFKNILWFRKS